MTVWLPEIEYAKRTFNNRLIVVPICRGCSCGCEPDGEWHYGLNDCFCTSLKCPCVIDRPQKPVYVPGTPL